jgi:uncharacterized protein YqeY
VTRRTLDDAEVAAVVESEVAERLEAATDYERLGRVDEANRLRSEAALLDDLLRAATTGSEVAPTEGATAPSADPG